MHKMITLLFFLVLSLSCLAQFNDSVHYNLRFASTGFLNKTNNGNSYLFNNALALNTKKKKVSFNTTVSWLYGAQQQHLSNNDFNAQAYINVYKGLHKLYWWGLLNYDRSYSLKINHRSQAGIGVAYNIIDSPFLKINVSDGILYEQADLRIAASGHDAYKDLRNSLRVQYRWAIKAWLIAEGIHFFQPSLTGVNDYFINSSSNLSLKLSKWFSFTTAVVYNKVNRTKRENLLITYGLTLEKFF